MLSFSGYGGITSAVPGAVPSIQHRRVTPPAPTATPAPELLQERGRRILGAGRSNMAAAPEAALPGFLEAVGIQGSPSPSHQWERLVLKRQEQEGNECRPQLTDLFIHRAFVFLPRVFRSPHPSLKTKPSSQETQTHGGGRSAPSTASHEDIPIPQLLWKALSRLMFHTLRLQSI